MKLEAKHILILLSCVWFYVFGVVGGVDIAGSIIFMVAGAVMGRAAPIFFFLIQ